MYLYPWCLACSCDLPFRGWPWQNGPISPCFGTLSTFSPATSNFLALMFAHSFVSQEAWGGASCQIQLHLRRPDRQGDHPAAVESPRAAWGVLQRAGAHAEARLPNAGHAVRLWEQVQTHAEVPQCLLAVQEVGSVIYLFLFQWKKEMEFYFSLTVVSSLFLLWAASFAGKINK